jgi:hypothetical protein
MGTQDPTIYLYMQCDTQTIGPCKHFRHLLSQVAKRQQPKAEALQQELTLGSSWFLLSTEHIRHVGKNSSIQAAQLAGFALTSA